MKIILRSKIAFFHYINDDSPVKKKSGVDHNDSQVTFEIPGLLKYDFSNPRESKIEQNFEIENMSIIKLAKKDYIIIGRLIEHLGPGPVNNIHRIVGRFKAQANFENSLRGLLMSLEENDVAGL